MKSLIAGSLLFMLPVLSFAGGWDRVLAQNKPKKHSLEALTGDDADGDASRWDSFYKKHSGYAFGKEPVRFLEHNLDKLPRSSEKKKAVALDIAMGEGRNAVFLAKHGFSVVGVDISPVALRKAKALAKESGVQVTTVLTDLNRYQIEPETYDVIVVFYYLQRSLIPGIIKGLKKGGVVLFETYTKDHLKHDKGFNSAYVLKPGELRELFKELKTVSYREVDTGKEAIASLIAKKP